MTNSSPNKPNVGTTLLLLTLPTVIALIVIFLLMRWPVPAKIRLDLTVDRVSFSIGGFESVQVTPSLVFQSIEFQKFTTIRFNPRKIELADPLQYVQEDRQFPESAWTSLSLDTPPVGAILESSV